MPLLKDLIGLFGVMDASAPVVAARLRHGSCALYVGGLGELFLASPTREAVVLADRKGFVKLALRAGAALVPTYMFGNTTVLETVTRWPRIAALSRRWGVSLTVSRTPLQFRFNVTVYESMRAIIVSRSRELVQR